MYTEANDEFFCRFVINSFLPLVIHLTPGAKMVTWVMAMIVVRRSPKLAAM